MNVLKRIPKFSLALLVVCSICFFTGSDHADPIDPFNRERLEGGLTDLFAFPVLADGKPAFPWAGNRDISLADPLKDNVRAQITPDEQLQMDSLVLVLCARRQLTQTGSLKLEPYRYQIHIDLVGNGEVDFGEAKSAVDDSAVPTGAGSASPGYAPSVANNQPSRPTPQEGFLRYGGLVSKPHDIREDLIIEFQLNDQAGLKTGFPKYTQSLSGSLNSDLSIAFTSGVFDDPFIFPAFFGTDVVAMIIKIPLKHFEPGQDFLIWATSHKGTRQIDHVGRSLRTQNPRFELLNTLHPSEHSDAIEQEHEHPGLIRDLAQRFNLNSIFSYRVWDMHVPDVMIYSRKYPVGFPNGRLLTDDVAALLAQLGDTLLLELSYQHANGTWPRQTKNDRNDGQFLQQFPYLLEPWNSNRPATPLRLSSANRWKLIGIAVLFVAALVLENWIVARWYHSWKNRRRFL